jgi:transglutaminase-like putative cysteine protease
MRIPLKPDNNTWLLAALAFAIAPHTPRLPIWITLLCLGVGATRLIQVRLPARWLLITLAVATAAGIYASYHTLLGRDAGVALLVAMLSLKLLESRTLRDSMVAIFISYFLVITHFLYSQSIPTGLYLLVVVLAITATLIGLNHPGRQIDPRKQLRLAAVLLGQATPVMLALFLFFPRVPGPLWGMPSDAYEGMTGLSDSMAPGSISKLSQSGAVAFRVSFDGPPPKPEQRYWRGPVLDLFDGRRWSAAAATDRNPASIAVTGAPSSYTLTLEPHNKRWLLALDLPAELPPGSRLGARYELLADQPVRQRLRYRAVSYPNYHAGLYLEGAEMNRSLRLPALGNPKARKMAVDWKLAAKDDGEIVSRALELFRSDAFFYSLTPPLLGADSVDEFLFDTRRGFCEHYAGSFVFLMRVAGVPARVVTGYQGGEPNSFGNYLIVRQSDAHAWAEVWLESRGWVRIDPTAAVAPRRIESGLAAALPAGEPLPLLARIDSALLMQLRMTWDTLNNDWNLWVLGYGQERQYDLLSRLGFEMASWKELAAGLAAAVGALLLGFSGFMLWRRSPVGTDPAAGIYQCFCRKLARIGIVRQPNEGPADFTKRTAMLRPDLASDSAEIGKLYIALRYAPHPNASALRQMRKRVGAFRPNRIRS